MSVYIATLLSNRHPANIKNNYFKKLIKNDFFTDLEIKTYCKNAYLIIFQKTYF